MKGHFSRNSERTSGTSHKDNSPSKTDYKNKSQVKTVLLTERYHPPPPQNIIHSEPITTINFDKTKLYDTHPQQFGTGQQQIIFHIGFQSRLQVIKDDMNVGAPRTLALAATISRLMSASRTGTKLIVPIPALEHKTRFNGGNSSQFRPRGQISLRAPQSRFTIHETNRGSQSCV